VLPRLAAGKVRVQMRFTIVTPSYNQLDWLGLCVASVRDQVSTGCQHTANGVRQTDDKGGGSRVAGGEREDRAAMPLTIEHIVQDAGTPGIEDFAKEQGANFYRDGELVFGGRPRGVSDDLHGPRGEGYSLTIYSEKDAGMYDAVNRGLRKGTGEICAYLNCDEQYLPGALHWVGRFFAESKKVEVLFGDVITISPDGKALCHRKASLPHPWHVMIAQLPIFTAATFFRSELVKKGLLFPDGWRDLGDAVWTIELRRRGVRCRV
jgi:glycosyltransferase involved in cell wall biosynthesis